MKKLIAEFSLMGTVFALISLGCFAVVISAGSGLISFSGVWGFWYLGLLTTLLAVLSIAGWGTCCGLKKWRQRHDASMPVGQ